MKFDKQMLIAAVLAAGLAFTSAARAQAQEQIVKIGHVGPITGSDAQLGKDNENGARLAVEDLNAKGIVLGGKKIRFELQAEDDAGDPKQANAVATKLVDAKVAAVVGHLNSGTSIPASKIYAEAGIPQVSPSATNPKYTQQGYKTAFRIVANDAQLGSELGLYAVNKLGAKTFAIIDDRTAYGQGVAQEFTKGVKANRGAIMSVQYTNNTATDFTAILTAIKSKKPDVIFFGGMEAAADPMLRQMKQLGITAKYMGGDGICTATLAGAGMPDDQVVCATPGGVGAAGQKALNDFRAKYKKRYGIDMVYNAPYAYDATVLIAEAMKKADSWEPAKYLPFLAQTDYQGLTGHIAFDAKGDLRDSALTIYTYHGGQQVMLEVIGK